MKIFYILLSFCSALAFNGTKRDSGLIYYTQGNWDFSELQLNGDCTNLNPPGSPYLLLTKSEGNKASGAISLNKISLPDQSSFSTSFTFRMQQPGVGGADGIVFVINSKTNVVGSLGGGIGYGCVTNSVGIELDTYQNTESQWSCVSNKNGYPTGTGYNNNGDRSNNHVGINVNGSPASLASRDWPTRFCNGNPHYVWIDYDGSTKLLSVRISDFNARPLATFLSLTLDLVAVLGSTDVYVGFTAATGGSYETHEILDWAFASSFDPVDALLTLAARTNLYQSVGSISYLEGVVATSLSSTYIGQSLCITNNIVKDPTSPTYFNIFDSSGDPFATGTLYIFTSEYSGLPSDLATASVLTKTSTIQNGRWVIDSSITFVYQQRYWFYIGVSSSATLAAHKDASGNTPCFPTYYISDGSTVYVKDPKYGFAYDLTVDITRPPSITSGTVTSASMTTSPKTFTTQVLTTAGMTTAAMTTASLTTARITSAGITTAAMTTGLGILDDTSETVNAEIKFVNKFIGQTVVPDKTSYPGSTTTFYLIKTDSSTYANSVLYVFKAPYTGSPTVIDTAKYWYRTSANAAGTAWVFPSSVKFYAGVKYYFYLSVAVTVNLNAFQHTSKRSLSRHNRAVNDQPVFEYDDVSTYIADVGYTLAYRLISEIDDGTAVGDPIFMGFNNKGFVFDGVIGKVFNIYNDPFINVNSEFGEAHNIEHKGTVMVKIGVSVANHNILVDVMDKGEHEFGVTIDGVRTIIGSIPLEITGTCVSIQYKDELLISTPKHSIFITPKQGRSRHLNVPYLNLHVHHPLGEDTSKIGGVLGQTASTDNIDLEEQDFEVESLFSLKDSKFYHSVIEC